MHSELDVQLGSENTKVFDQTLAMIIIHNNNMIFITFQTHNECIYVPQTPAELHPSPDIHSELAVQLASKDKNFQIKA